MDTPLFRLALAAFVAAPAFAATPASSHARPSDNTTLAAPAEDIRRKLREAGVPEEKIAVLLGKTKAAFSVSDNAGASAARTGTNGAPAAGASSAVGAGTMSGVTAPAPVRPSELNTAALDAQALSSKDPELAAARKIVEDLKQEKSLLEARVALAETRRRKELADSFAEKTRIDAERALLLARAAAKASEAENAKSAIDREGALLSSVASAKQADKNNRLKDLENEARRLRSETEAEQSAAASRLATIKAKAEARRHADAAPEYPSDPLKNGVLKISDRRIPFNGPVTDELADFVTERIAFYNNADTTKPVFIVIDSSPGGSVMAGYRMLNAMKSSKAPVYVVVKQFAASMAAITTTMADRSFVYPGTIILHHQMSTGFGGNMRTLAERMRMTNDLFERIFTPVYTKIGYKTSAEFVDDMYRHFKSGDWAAFGDDAVRMKWASDTVERIEETSVVENTANDVAGATPGMNFSAGCELRRDENGKAYFALPALVAPGDAWDLHDPQGVFRPSL